MISTVNNTENSSSLRSILKTKHKYDCRQKAQTITKNSNHKFISPFSFRMGNYMFLTPEWALLTICKYMHLKVRSTL